MRPVCPDALSSSRRCCSHTRRPSSDEHSEILCRRCSSYSPGIFWRGLTRVPPEEAEDQIPRVSVRTATSVTKGYNNKGRTDLLLVGSFVGVSWGRAPIQALALFYNLLDF